MLQYIPEYYGSWCCNIAYSAYFLALSVVIYIWTSLSELVSVVHDTNNACMMSFLKDIECTTVCHSPIGGLAAERGIILRPVSCASDCCRIRNLIFVNFHLLFKNSTRLISWIFMLLWGGSFNGKGFFP